MKEMVAEKPAVAGGVPAVQTEWPKAGPRYGEEELQELKEAIDQGTLFYAHGKKVSQLEQDFASKYDVDFAVACSSGTAAIHTAMMAVEVSPGDEVIVPPITDMGSLIPVLFQGAIPVFADLHLNSHVLLPESVEAAITPRTRAVLAVHLWGNACDMKALRAICDRNNVALIEDCAQAFGCRCDDKPIGTLGDIGCFSFNEYKHISCGDGGLCVTNDLDLARRLRLATDKCYSREKDAAVRDPFFLAANYRMTELQGAVGIAQLRKLDDIIARRRKYCSGLSERLQGVEGIVPPEVTAGCEPSWWFYMLRVEPEVLGVDATTFAQALSAEGIGAGAHYIQRPVYEYPIFRDHSAFARGSHAYMEREYRTGLCPNAERILETCVLLTAHQNFTDAHIDETALGIRRLCQWYRDR